MYYVDSDSTGKIIAFYNDLISSSIPESAITISDGQWQDCIDNQGKWIVDKTINQLVLAPPVVVQPPIPQPNWLGFIAACDQVEVGGNGLFQKLLTADFNLAMNIYLLLLRLKDKNDDLEIRTINFLYSQLLPLLSEEDRNDLGFAAQTNNIPITF